jgi:hypothetical protein
MVAAEPLFALTPRGDGHVRFESGEGGRLVATDRPLRKEWRSSSGFRAVPEGVDGLFRLGRDSFRFERLGIQQDTNPASAFY